MTSIIPVPPALVRRADEIISAPIDHHGLRYLPNSWIAKVPDDDVAALVQRFPTGYITRGDLFVLGNDARRRTRPALRRLLLATMMWGYGTRGGRSYRNARTALADPSIDDRLDRTIAALQRGDLRAAYTSIDGLRGYDEGFFTKYLYFATSKAEWEDGRVRPLIFDSTVRTTLQFLAEVLGSDWTTGADRRCARVDRYDRYCASLSRWAEELTRTGHSCTADQVERFLYEPGDLMFNPAQQLRILTAALVADVADVADGRAGSRVMQAVATLPADLIASVQQPN